MKKIVLLLSFTWQYALMTESLVGQVVIKDSLIIAPMHDKSNLETIQLQSPCAAPMRRLALFSIYPGTVTIEVLPIEITVPGLTLGPLYLSNARFIGQGDTINVFSDIAAGHVWTREFTQIRQATIWLVLGPEGTPDSGPDNEFHVLGDYAINFNFF